MYITNYEKRNETKVCVRDNEPKVKDHNQNGIGMHTSSIITQHDTKHIQQD
jgi:hypothetical protein